MKGKKFSALGVSKYTFVVPSRSDNLERKYFLRPKRDGDFRELNIVAVYSVLHIKRKIRYNKDCT